MPAATRCKRLRNAVGVVKQKLNTENERQIRERGRRGEGEREREGGRGEGETELCLFKQAEHV